MPNAPQRYHWALVTLHWVSGLFIVMMLILGTFVTGATPNSDPEKLNHLRGHMPVGVFILVLMLVRLVVRHLTDKPGPAPGNSPMENRLSSTVHVLLYVLVFAMAGSGIGMAVMANLPAVVFQGQGSLPADFSHLWPRAVHGAGAVLLTLLIALHIAAALKHQLIKKDNIMARMKFGPRM